MYIGYRVYCRPLELEMKASGSGVLELRGEVKGSRGQEVFRIKYFGFRILDLGFRILGSGFRI